MSLIFNAKAFDRIRPRTGTGFPLRKPGKPFPQVRRTNNPVAVLVHFAASLGLVALSARTVRMLRDHPYYRYAFYPLIRHFDPISSDTLFAESDRPRMIELLRDPDLLNDQDIYQGIRSYLNNFTGYLPGGIYRVPSILTRNQPIQTAVDRALRQMGRSEKEVRSLHWEMKEEQHCYDEYSKRARFMKLALQAFELVVKEGFDPAELWH